METINEEEMKEQLAEEMAKYEEEGYFKRLFKMFAGLGRPHASREYKEAVIELQRQIAPLLAILVPVIGATILFVVTAMGGSSAEKINVEIAQVEKEEEKLDEIEKPPETEPPPDMDVDVQMDSPSISPVEAAEVAPPTAEPQSVKVASVDAMLNIKSPVTMKSVAGTARNAGVRGRYTGGGAQYGDANTERAVMKALRWLKLHQNPDGSWPGVKPASTGLAILTYLAHGETPSSPEFGKTVERGLEFLINCISEKGGKTVMNGTDGHEYAFLIGTYALCEAYGMTKNPNARTAAEKTLRRIIKGQSPTGGWDYNMKASSTRDDLSFAGWALQAIKAGKMAGIHLDGMEECIKKAIKCLQTRNFRKGGFNYTAGGNPTGLTATGCLAMQLLGYSNTKEVKEALDYMKDWVPTFDKDAALSKTTRTGSCPQYYCYYAAQCKYQAGMAKNAASGNQALWKKWNAEMKALYPSTIIDDKNKDGTPVTIKDVKGNDRPVGHWVNKDAHTTRPVMDTCLAALQLMVYYRYLPTTQLKATEVEVDVESLSKDKSGEINVTIDI